MQLLELIHKREDRRAIAEAELSIQDQRALVSLEFGLSELFDRLAESCVVYPSKPFSASAFGSFSRLKQLIYLLHFLGIPGGLFILGLGVVQQDICQEV